MGSLCIDDKDIRRALLDEILAKSDGHIYIFGNGEYSKIIVDYIRNEGSYAGSFTFVVDDEYCPDASDDVLPLSAFVSSVPEEAVVVFGVYNYPLVQKMRSGVLGRFRNVYDLHFVVVNGERVRWDARAAKERQNEYQKTYDMLGDERSRNLMQAYLNAATSGQFHQLFAGYYEAPSYFNRITSGLPVDTLIDCGAYDEDSIHDFVGAFPRYRKVIAFEPDEKNVSRIRDRIKREGIGDVSIHMEGVGESEGSLYFNEPGESNSFLSEAGNKAIKVSTLDSIQDEVVGTALLKMDIEGSELDALRGGQNLIRDLRPVMAICVYHKESDLIDIPQFIASLVEADSYSYYLGFHGLDLAELCLYALPNELMACQPSQGDLE